MVYGIISPIFGVLTCLSVNGIISYTYPAAEILGIWYCHTFETLSIFGTVYVGIFSVLAAAMRYWFIVKNEKAESIGKEKCKRIFLFVHLAIPLVMAPLHAVSNGEPVHNFWLNQCWGHPMQNTVVESGLWKKIGDNLCFNREYEIESYTGAVAGRFFEPVLRGVCGGLTIFTVIFLSNTVELIVYVMLFKHIDRYVYLNYVTLYSCVPNKASPVQTNSCKREFFYWAYFICNFRSHNEGNQNLARFCQPNARSEDATLRRNHRHRTKKILLVVDYIIEGISGVVLFVIIFVTKKNVLLQYVLLSLITFVYAVPIPISYLINEKRVKDTVIASGWVAGFKSIFHSAETIRRLERERLANLLIRENQPPIRVNTAHNIATPSFSTVQRNSTRKRNCEEESINGKRVHKKRKLGKRSNRIDGVRADIPNHLPTTINPIDVSSTGVNSISRYNNATIQNAKRYKRHPSCTCIQTNLVLVDLEHDSDQITSQHSSTCLENTDCKSHVLQEILADRQISVDTRQYKQVTKILSLSQDENFKSFSRDYILRRTLRSLENSSNELNCLVYLQHLCNLEKLFLGQMEDQISVDFIVSLINAWHLFKQRSTTTESDGHRAANGSSENATKIFTGGPKREKYLQRKRIIDLLLINVSIDPRYSHYLKELCDLEEKDIQECW